MHRLNYKSSFVILAYSLLLSLVFLFGMTYIQYSATSVEYIEDDSYIYPLNEDEFLSIYQGNEQVLDMDQIDTSKNQYHEYAQAAMHQMWPFMIFFCFFLMGSSYLLWRILYRLQKKQTALISSQFQNAKEQDIYDFHDSNLNAAYEEIKQTYQGYLNDYKRLNSYLSHEQKNAIAILRTNMEVHHQHEYLPQLDYISNSIDDILTLSEQGEISETGIVDVSLCCAEICDLYKKSYPLIEFDFDTEHTCDILGKERWIYRAVSNLIDNAIKYGKQKPIHVRVHNQHHSVIITVQDHGIGMDDEQVARIFQYQYRINELHKNGYGIGLSLVAHVCDLCGGYAYVESKPKAGSIFYLSFPEYQSS